MAATAVLVLNVASRSAAQNANSNGNPDGKPTCIGCSVDGKTTPRVPDGHPDLGGFWDDQEGGGNNLGTSPQDGSILFDLGGKPGANPRRPATAAAGAATDFT